MAILGQGSSHQKGEQEGSQGPGNVLFLDLHVGYKNALVCENSSGFSFSIYVLFCMYIVLHQKVAQKNSKHITYICAHTYYKYAGSDSVFATLKLYITYNPFSFFPINIICPTWKLFLTSILEVIISLLPFPLNRISK